MLASIVSKNVSKVQKQVHRPSFQKRETIRLKNFQCFFLKNKKISVDSFQLLVDLPIASTIFMQLVEVMRFCAIFRWLLSRICFLSDRLGAGGLVE